MIKNFLQVKMKISSIYLGEHSRSHLGCAKGKTPEIGKLMAVDYLDSTVATHSERRVISPWVWRLCRCTTYQMVGQFHL